LVQWRRKGCGEVLFTTIAMNLIGVVGAVILAYLCQHALLEGNWELRGFVHLGPIFAAFLVLCALTLLVWCGVTLARLMAAKGPVQTGQ
jgi:hypothetical protein